MEEHHKYEAILNFFAITGTQDSDIAMTYLNNSNWDVSEAAGHYLGSSNIENEVRREPDPVHIDRPPPRDQDLQIDQPQPGFVGSMWSSFKGYVSS